MGDLVKAVAGKLRRAVAQLAPRCFVLVIFGDGSFLVARFSRLEPAREEFRLEGEAGRCELAADLGSLRVYRYVRTAACVQHAQPVSEIVQ